MAWFVLAGMTLFAALGYLAGKSKARSPAGPPWSSQGRASHFGAYVAIWSLAPAVILLAALGLASPSIETALLESRLSPATASATPLQKEVLVRDAQALARGQSLSDVTYSPELRAEVVRLAKESARISDVLTFGGAALGVVVSLVAGLLALARVGPKLRARERVEDWIDLLLLCSSAIAVLTTVGIVASLVLESLRFFSLVPPYEFLTGLQWSPQIAMRADQAGQSGAFGAVPLFVGTFLVMLIAMVVAGPVGLFSAVFLAEYASPTVRAVVKPMLEILAGVPTVVYGFFAALTVGPSFRWAFHALGEKLAGGPLDPLGQYLMTVQNQMALVAGVVMGIMLIPFVSSLADDVINAVPQSLRDGSYAMGATKSETIKRVVLPAALPGVAGAFLLAVSRAIGETMIVTMAAGLQAKMTMNPLESVTTVTVQIVTLLTGDQEFDSAKTLAAFGLGLTLFVVTLILNVIALRIVQAYREQYD